MTDRAEYISYLESQAERANAICLETEEVGVGLKGMRARMDELEEKIRSTTRTVELIQEHGTRAGESARVGRMEIEDQIRVVENRIQRLEHSSGDTRTTTEAEMARLRNEVTLAVQDFGQRVDERIQALRAWRSEADEGASGIIREAQATCVRLADDALGAVEASQHKLQELSHRTEANLEVLRVDVTGLKAELAGISQLSTPNPTNRMDTTGPVAETGIAATAADTVTHAASAIAESVERKLGARLGQQVLQLSDVLRRVVQAQGTLQQQFSGGTGAAAYASSHGMLHPQSPAGVAAYAPSLVQSPALVLQSAQPGPALQPATLPQATDFTNTYNFGFPLAAQAGPIPSFAAEVAGAGGAGATVVANSAGDIQRRAAIDDLYEELRRLEECDVGTRRGPSPSAGHGNGAAVRPRSARSAERRSVRNAPCLGLASSRMAHA